MPIQEPKWTNVGNLSLNSFEIFQNLSEKLELLFKLYTNSTSGFVMTINDNNDKLSIYYVIIFYIHKINVFYYFI